jgi:hypothetical protein
LVAGLSSARALRRAQVRSRPTLLISERASSSRQAPDR